MITNLQAWEVVEAAIKRQKQQLLDEANAEWERAGQGCYAEFVGRYMACHWMMIAAWN